MWLTIFPDLENIHLPKDVVYFGNTSSKLLGMQHAILAYDNDIDASEFLNAGTKILFMKRIFGRALLDVAIWFIVSNYRPKVVHLFHFCRSSCLIAFYLKLFCLLNSSCFQIILKLDAGTSTLRGYKMSLFFLCSIFFDIITIESKKIYESVLKSKVSKKVVLVPNGILVGEVPQILDNTVKENSIVVMSRYGTYQKNTEQLFRVAPVILNKYPNWTIHCFGRVETNFKDQIQKFLLKNNNLKSRIIFYGFAPRETFEEKLISSKIYLNTSRWEGFSAAFLDARAFGLKIVSSEVNALDELFEDFQCGYSFPVDCDDKLLVALEAALNDDQYFTSKEYKDNAEQFVSQYSWDQVVAPLVNKISLNYG